MDSQQRATARVKVLKGTLGHSQRYLKSERAPLKNATAQIVRPYNQGIKSCTKVKTVVQKPWPCLRVVFSATHDIVNKKGQNVSMVNKLKLTLNPQAQLYFHMQTAWIWMRRRVTRRLIQIQAIWQLDIICTLNHHKIWIWVTLTFFCDIWDILSTMSNSLDPDQRAPIGALWSGSKQFEAWYGFSTAGYWVESVWWHGLLKCQQLPNKNYCSFHVSLSKAFLQ